MVKVSSILHYQAALNYAISTNQLISIRSLSSPFSAVAQQALISYGESNNIVTFMLQKYGKGKMVQLLNVFHQGATFDDALNQVYGFDQDGLDMVWRANLLNNYNPASPSAHIVEFTSGLTPVSAVGG